MRIRIRAICGYKSHEILCLWKYNVASSKSITGLTGSHGSTSSHGSRDFTGSHGSMISLALLVLMVPLILWEPVEP